MVLRNFAYLCFNKTTKHMKISRLKAGVNYFAFNTHNPENQQFTGKFVKIADGEVVFDNMILTVEQFEDWYAYPVLEIIGWDWDKIKNGEYYRLQGKRFYGQVSKGRKMLQFDMIVKTDENVTSYIKGRPYQTVRDHRESTMIFDYGKTITCTSRHKYPSESYDLPSGEKTSNRWDLYEYHKNN